MNAQKIDKPIFMIGMPRSGTTVLSEAISLHKDLGWFSNYLNHFPFLPWIAILDRMAALVPLKRDLRGRKRQSDEKSAFFRQFLPYSVEAFKAWQRCFGGKFLWDYLLTQIASEDEKRFTMNYIRTVLKCQGKPRFFTKLTGPPRIHYLGNVFADSCFIHILRDPRAVVSSLLKVPFWIKNGGLERPWWLNGLPERYIEEWENHDRLPVALAAIQWKRVVELTHEESEMLAPEMFFEIRYEDFVESPDEALSMIFRRFKLANCSAPHRYILSVGKLRNMNYKFKMNLSSDEIDIIEKITFATAKKAGYHFN